MKRKTAVMLAGLGGATASSTVASLAAFAETPNESMRSTTTRSPFTALDLVEPGDLVFGGWDMSSRSVFDRYIDLVPASQLSASVSRRLRSIMPKPAAVTSLDIPKEVSHDNRDGRPPLETVGRLVEEMREFTTEHGAESLIVLYLGSPHAGTASDTVLPMSWDDLRSAGDRIPSSLLYGLAAAEAGGHYVDFTPGLGLESELLQHNAREKGVQLAGRDGSTGQTMFKMMLGELLLMRNIRIDGWYSTNVIGNHDGYVLSNPAHLHVKLSDKRDGLGALHQDKDIDHKVTIDYVPHWGDRKESWDAISASGWLDNSIEIRVNWRGTDSLLAAPMIFDLVRLLEIGGQRGYSGFQEDLGFFFKRPFGREGEPLSSLYAALVDRYCI